jgi:hypothetical protein
MRLLLRVLRLSWADRVLAAEMVLRLGAARLALAALPFRVTAARLGVPMAATLNRDLDPADMRFVARLRWITSAVARRVPWRADCLPQAIAVMGILARRRIPATVYFGVRDPASAARFEAHAWVRAGSAGVTGWAGREVFHEVMSFAACVRPKEVL